MLSARALRRSPDVVHAHGTEEAYAMAAQATGKPYVITLQGVFSIINRELPPKLVSRERVVQLLERHTLRKTKHVIAKSDYIGDRIAQLFPQLEIHRIPNTFDLRLLALDMIKVPRTACFVGMVTKRKGLDLVVEALRHMDKENYPAKFHVIGNRGGGEDHYDRRVLSELRQLLGDRLVLHGILPVFQVAEIVAQCEILVAPSREEMFGNQLIEGLLVGAMPIVTDGTALAENVRRFGYGRIVRQQDAANLATALITELRTNQLQKKTRAEKARRLLIERMHPRVVSAAHQKIYRMMLEK